MKNKITGTYQIINTVNKKLYIGSSDDINERWNRHKSDLNAGNHHNDHLQAAWEKYTVDAFQFHIIDIVNDSSESFKYEQSLLDILWDDGKHCYNISRSATSPMRGRKQSPEHIAKRVAANTGKKRSQDTKDKMSKSLIGNKRRLGQTFTCSEETRAKISAANTGRRKK